MFNKFIAFILNESGNSYIVKQDGTVDTTSTPTAIEPIFEGWQEMDIGYERDPKKLGVVRSFTLPISVVSIIRKIIRTIVITLSTEEKVDLLLQSRRPILNDTFWHIPYDYFYKAQLDLTTYKYGDDRDSISLSEGGIKKLIDTNEGTTYEIDIDSDPEKVALRMDGIELQQSGDYIFLDGIDIPKSTYGSTFSIPLEFINSEGLSTGVNYRSQTLKNLDGLTLPQRLADSNEILDSSEFNRTAISVTLHGTLKFTCVKNDPHIGFRARFMKSSQDFANQNDYQIFDAGVLVPGTVYTYAFNLTVSLQPTERLYLHGIYYGGATGAVDISVNFSANSVASFSYKNRADATIVYCLKPSTVLKRLGQKIGLKLSEIETAFIEQFDNLLLTSGDGIRGLVNSVIKTSLVDFSKFVMVNMAGGQGVENGKLLFGSYDHFYNPNNPIPLGDVVKFKCYPANDLKGNILKIGYPKQEIDDVNGKYSFNNTVIRTTPSSIVKDLDYVSPYIFDGFYAEITRRNLEGKKTTDDKADSLVFILNSALKTDAFTLTFEMFFTAPFIGVVGVVDKNLFLPGATITITGTQFNNGSYTIADIVPNATGALVGVIENVTAESNVLGFISYGTRILKRVTYDAVTGIPEPDFMFNIEDGTPYRLVLLQRRWFDSIFWGLAGKKIVFQSTDRGTISTEKNGVIIDEKADYTIGTDIIFKPWYFEFDTIVPTDLIDLLEANINRCFSFEWYGNTYKGFLQKAKLSTNDNKAQGYKLLCTPDTDLTNLIYE